RHRRATEVLRAVEGVRHSPACRHVRRCHRGALMMLPLLVFLVVGAIVGLLAFLGFKYGPGELAKRRLELRLREVSSSSESKEEGEAPATVVRREADGPLPAVERAVLKTEAGSKLALLIEQSGVETTPSAILLASVGAATVAALLTLLFVPFLIIVPIAALIAG